MQSKHAFPLTSLKSSDKTEHFDEEEGSDAMVRKELVSADTEAITCPICLDDAVELLDKAVVNPCMHVFCTNCLKKWLLTYQNTCPMCKAKAISFYYQITETGTYNEREIPPPRPQISTGEFHTYGGGVQAFRGGYDSRYPNRRLHPAYPFTADQRGWQDPHFVRDRLQNQNPEIPNRLSRRSTLYHHRVMAHTVPRPQQNFSDNRITQWRRTIYMHDFWAQAPSNQNFLMYNHNTARLDEWVRRELSAISRTRDVGVLVSLVQSLALRASLIGGRVPQNWSDRSQQDQEAINQLRRFLANETEHFWHELRCFQASRLNIANYDETVRYQTRQGASAGSSTSLREFTDMMEAQDFDNAIFPEAVRERVYTGPPSQRVSFNIPIANDPNSSSEDEERVSDDEEPQIGGRRNPFLEAARDLSSNWAQERAFQSNHAFRPSRNGASGNGLRLDLVEEEAERESQRPGTNPRINSFVELDRDQRTEIGPSRPISVPGFSSFVRLPGSQISSPNPSNSQPQRRSLNGERRERSQIQTRKRRFSELFDDNSRDFRNPELRSNNAQIPGLRPVNNLQPYSGISTTILRPRSLGRRRDESISLDNYSGDEEEEEEESRESEFEDQHWRAQSRNQNNRENRQKKSQANFENSALQIESAQNQQDRLPKPRKEMPTKNNRREEKKEDGTADEGRIRDLALKNLKSYLASTQKSSSDSGETVSYAQNNGASQNSQGIIDLSSPDSNSPQEPSQPSNIDSDSLDTIFTPQNRANQAGKRNREKRTHVPFKMNIPSESWSPNARNRGQNKNDNNKMILRHNSFNVTKGLGVQRSLSRSKQQRKGKTLIEVIDICSDSEE